MTFWLAEEPPEQLGRFTVFVPQNSSVVPQNPYLLQDVSIRPGDRKF